MGYRFYIAEVDKKYLSKIDGLSFREIEKKYKREEYIGPETIVSKILKSKDCIQVGDYTANIIDGKEYDTYKYFNKDVIENLRNDNDFCVINEEVLIAMAEEVNRMRIETYEEYLENHDELKRRIDMIKILAFDNHIYSPDTLETELMEIREWWGKWLRNEKDGKYIYILYAW